MVGYLVGRVEVQGEQLLFEDLCGLRLLGIWKILGQELRIYSQFQESHKFCILSCNPWCELNSAEFSDTPLLSFFSDSWGLRCFVGSF